MDVLNLPTTIYNIKFGWLKHKTFSKFHNFQQAILLCLILLVHHKNDSSKKKKIIASTFFSILETLKVLSINCSQVTRTVNPLNVLQMLTFK